MKSPMQVFPIIASASVFPVNSLREDILKEIDRRGKPVLGEKTKSHDSDICAGENF